MAYQAVIENNGLAQCTVLLSRTVIDKIDFFKIKENCFQITILEVYTDNVFLKNLNRDFCVK